MKIGPCRQRVTWQTKTTAQDSFGQDQDTWTTQGTFWAQVSPISAHEQIIATAEQAALVDYRVVMRWVGNIKEHDRLLYTRYLPGGATEAVTLQISSVIDTDEIHRMLTLLCVEVR